MNYYLDKYEYGNTLAEVAPSGKLGIVVVIPCRNDPELLSSLRSLRACSLPESDTEVLAIVYHREEPGNTLQVPGNRLEKACEWSRINSGPRLTFHIISITLPAGGDVEMARQAGMDEGMRRFEQTLRREGIIACYDAGTLCDTNYLQELERHFRSHPHTSGSSIYFEHGIEGVQDLMKCERIVQYELNTRYYINSLRYCRHPYAHQGIGAGLAVRSSAYKARKTNASSGKGDLHFLRSLPETGDFTDINTTRLIPADPMLEEEWHIKAGASYHNFQVFEELRAFFNMVDDLYSEESLRNSLDELPETIRAYFLMHGDFRDTMRQLKHDTYEPEHFRNKFFQWFNTSEILTYLDFAAEFFFPKTHYDEPLEQLFIKIAPEVSCSTAREYLLHLREREKNGR